MRRGDADGCRVDGVARSDAGAPQSPVLSPALWSRGHQRWWWSLSPALWSRGHQCWWWSRSPAPWSRPVAARPAGSAAADFERRDRKKAAHFNSVDMMAIARKRHIPAAEGPKELFAHPLTLTQVSGGRSVAS